MLKTILIATAQLVVLFGGPVALSFFGWSQQEIVDVALQAFVGVMLLGGLLGLPSLIRFMIGIATPVLSMVLLAFIDILVRRWSGTYESGFFDKNTEMFLGLLTSIWILVSCGLWYAFGREKKE